jgi:hypothetical protein
MTQFVQPSPAIVNDLRRRISNAPQLKTYLDQLVNFNALTLEQVKASLSGDSLQLLSQDSNLTGVLLSVTSSGLYLISVQHETMFAGTGGKLRTTVNWTDESGAKSRIIATDIDLTIPDEEDGIAIVRCSGGTQILYSTVVSGAAGAPTYNLFSFIKQMA